MYVNLDNPRLDHNRIYAFMRADNPQISNLKPQIYLIVCNFSDREGEVGINIPQHALDFLGIPEAVYSARDLLSGKRYSVLMSASEQAVVYVGAWTAAILQLRC